MSNLDPSDNPSTANTIVLDCSRLDITQADSTRALLKPAALHATSDLNIDMRNVEFVDSSGLAALVSARKSLDPSLKVCLRNVSEKIEKLLKLTRLDQVFEISGT